MFTSVKHQITDLLNVLYQEHATLHHIKPHGALYNLAATNKKVANVIIEVIKSMQHPVQLYAPYQSVIAKLAQENNMAITYEAFADRNYNKDLTLVSRQNNNAIIRDENKMLKHVLNMVKHQKVRTVNGENIQIEAHTFCVHGDNPNAISLVRNLHERLLENSIDIK